jgi:hypothetical protein
MACRFRDEFALLAAEGKVTDAPRTGIPAPEVLLAIQAGGGALSLIPIATLTRFATLNYYLFIFILLAAIANFLLSTYILLAVITKIPRVMKFISSVSERGLCRIVIIYDMLMLGSLVCFTGGSEGSAFTPQAAAVLPMAMLIKDAPSFKWTYAVVFVLMYLIGLQSFSPFVGYTDEAAKRQWLIIFFFIFTLFPVIYSIFADADKGA